MLTKGTKVRGKYYGVPFRGVVNFSRPHSMNNDVIYWIDLDGEITVFDDPRRAICVDVDPATGRNDTGSIVEAA